MLILHPRPADSITEEALKAAVWVDLVDPTDEEVALVASALGLQVPTRAALSEIESSSRLQIEGQTLRLSSPLLAHADTPHQTLTPVGFTLTPEVLLTVRFARLKVFDAVAARLVQAPEPSSGGVFTLLLEAVVDRSADLLENIAAELEGVSRTIFQRDRGRHKHANYNDTLRQTLVAVGQVGDRLSEIRASLLGVGRIVPFACEVAGWILPDHHRRLSAVRQDVVSLDDFEEHLTVKVQFLLDAVLGFINTEQNDLFKILTIVSVVGVPPTLVASIYGMNFRHMPELEWPWGYPFALALIVATAVAPMLWFKWKRWW